MHRAANRRRSTMRRLAARGIIPLVFCAGCLIGSLLSHGSGLAAQTTPPGTSATYPGGVVPPPQTNGKAMFWSAEDVKKRLTSQKDSSNTLTWSPQYRLTLMKRDYLEPQQMTRVSKVMSHWGDGEMH